MSAFFIRRPVFAIVIAAVIMLAGIVSIFSLPIAQYPSIAPPAVTITATYPGASAETMANAVTQVIEQQLKGLDHLLYFSSTSSSNGQAVITVTFGGRDQSGHRPGPGAEQAAVGDPDPAGPGAAAGAAGGEVAGQRPAGGRALRQQRQAYEPRRLRLSELATSSIRCRA